MLAILVKAKVLTNDAGQQLSKKLGSEIHRAEYVDAVQTIEDVSGDIKNFIYEPWLTEIARLERRITELEGLVVPGGPAKVVSKPAAKPKLKKPIAVA